MVISIAEAQRLGFISKPEKRAARKPYVHPLTKRLAPICERYGWQVDVYRAFCTSPESPQNTAETVAKPNAVVVWREAPRACVVHLGWLWAVQGWSDEQVVAELKKLEGQG